MRFELTPKNPNVADLTINQNAWLPIWLWLCEKYQDSWEMAPTALTPEFIDAGRFNKGLRVDAATARRFAVILSNHGDDPAYPEELRVFARAAAEGTRAQRLVKFFRECGGFEIW